MLIRTSPDDLKAFCAELVDSFDAKKEQVPFFDPAATDSVITRKVVTTVGRWSPKSEDAHTIQRALRLAPAASSGTCNSMAECIGGFAYQRRNMGAQDGLRMHSVTIGMRFGKIVEVPIDFDTHLNFRNLEARASVLMLGGLLHRASLSANTEELIVSASRRQKKTGGLIGDGFASHEQSTNILQSLGAVHTHDIDREVRSQLYQFSGDDDINIVLFRRDLAKLMQQTYESVAQKVLDGGSPPPNDGLFSGIPTERPVVQNTNVLIQINKPSIVSMD